MNSLAAGDDTKEEISGRESVCGALVHKRMLGSVSNKHISLAHAVRVTFRPSSLPFATDSFYLLANTKLVNAEITFAAPCMFVAASHRQCDVGR